jgi:DNA invertase Pin-like site-specific DNA recombinase
VLVKEGLDVTSTQGRLMLSLLGLCGEFESNIASERRVVAIEYPRRPKGRHCGLVLGPSH